MLLKEVIRNPKASIIYQTPFSKPQVQGLRKQNAIVNEKLRAKMQE